MKNNFKFINSWLAELNKNLNFFDKAQLIKLKDLANRIKKNKKKIFIIGNGGSASIASHFSVDMTKNAKIRSINLNEANLITCFANDYGFGNWIKKALEYYADKGDLLIAISSSGKSKNILNGVNFFRKKFGKVATFTGMSKSNPIKKKGDLNFWVNSRSYNIIENIHQIYLLILVDLIIRKKNYKSNL